MKAKKVSGENGWLRSPSVQMICLFFVSWQLDRFPKDIENWTADLQGQCLSQNQT